LTAKNQKHIKSSSAEGTVLKRKFHAQKNWKTNNST